MPNGCGSGNINHRFTLSTSTRFRAKSDLQVIDTLKQNVIKRTNVPNILEIGFGQGENLLFNAKQSQHINFTGIELFAQGASVLAKKALQNNLTNLEINIEDCREFFRKTNDKFNGIILAFPDPWNKRRHHKRRIIQQDFLHQLSKLLVPSGWVWIASDQQHYCTHIQKVLQQQPWFEFNRRVLPIEATLGEIISEWKGFSLVSTKYHQKNLANAEPKEFLCELVSA